MKAIFQTSQFKKDFKRIKKHHSNRAGGRTSNVRPKFMPAIVTGDYSEYPEPIREVFPYIYGEACEIRSNWQVYHHLFMCSQDRTDQLGRHLGPLLGIFQAQIEEENI